MTAPTMGVPADPWYAMERFAEAALAYGTARGANTATAYAETWLALRDAIAAYGRECAAEALAKVDAACERLSKAREYDDFRDGDGDGVLVEWEWWCGSPEWFIDAVPAANRGGGYVTPTAAILAAAAALDSIDLTPDTTTEVTP